MSVKPTYRNEDIKPISVKDLIIKISFVYRHLVRRKRLIVGITSGCALLGLLLSLVIAPNYIAQTTFVLQNTSKSGASYSSIAAKIGLSLPNSGNGLFEEDDNIIAFLQSRTIITRALMTRTNFGESSQLLVDRYISFNGLDKKWKGDERLKDLDYNKYPNQNILIADSILGVFYKRILDENLVVEKIDKNGDLLSVATTSKDQLFSKFFTDALIEKVSEFYIKTKTKKSEDNIRILQHQADSLRTLLNQALSGVAFSNEANPNPNPAFQRLKVPSQRRMVDVEMSKAVLEELVKNLELAKITHRQETPLIQIVDSAILPLEREKLGKLKGILIGGILGGMGVIIFLTLKLYVRSLLS